MKKSILIILFCWSIISCDRTEGCEEKYEYPNSIRVLTIDGDTAIIDNMSVQHEIGDRQIKIKKRK